MSTQKHDRMRVKKLVLHHFGDGQGPATSAADLIARASTGGYDYPSYDFGVLADGSIVDMRPLDVVGAHSQADRPKYMYGPNWWNLNAVGVVLGIDSTIFDPPPSMVEGLINFLVGFCKRQGMTSADCYPHFQIFRTLCPGASYSKLGLTTGLLNYNYVESELDRRLAGGSPDPVALDKPAVIVFGVWDLVTAYRLALKLKAPLIPREAQWKAMGFNKFYIVGGPEEVGPEFVNLTGDGWEQTVLEVLEALK